MNINFSFKLSELKITMSSVNYLHPIHPNTPSYAHRLSDFIAITLSASIQVKKSKNSLEAVLMIHVFFIS